MDRRLICVGGAGAARAGSMAARRHFLSSRDMRGNKNSSSAVLSTSWNESTDVPSNTRENRAMKKEQCVVRRDAHKKRARRKREIPFLSFASIPEILKLHSDVSYLGKFAEITTSQYVQDIFPLSV